MSSASYRMFVAARPPLDAVEHLDEFLEVRRQAGAYRWTPSDQFHVTLAFLPAVAERRLDELCERLGRVAARRTAFGTALAGGGAFPSALASRVLWAGLALDSSERETLGLLADGARAAASRSGIEVPRQRFRPHVTITRLGMPEDTTNWVRLLDTYRGPSWRLSEIELVASYLGQGPRGRPRHEPVATFDLAP